MEKAEESKSLISDISGTCSKKGVCPEPIKIVALPPAAIDTTLSRRYEFKYLISPAKATSIDNYVAEYLPLDRYSKIYPDGYYEICSLYLDSPDMRLCRESMTGVLNRYKLRIRCYSDNPSTPRFFEIKRRANTVIIKSRARVSAEDVPKILAGRFVQPLSTKREETEKLKQFMLYMQSIQAAPVVLIRYKRKAYEGIAENRVRVTFDKELCFKMETSPSVHFNGSSWQMNNIGLEWIILEIKYTGRFPAWLNRMIEYFNIQQHSVSKYATSIRNAVLLKFCAPKLPISVLYKNGLE